MTIPTTPTEPYPEIEFWFEFASTYSYLSVMRIEDAAQRWGIRVQWRPFLLGPIFKSLGMETSPFLLQQEKGAYMWKDMARQCEKYELPWTRPSRFPRPGLLPARIAIVGAAQPWIGAFCRKVMARSFASDQDIDQPGHIAPILTELGLSAPEVLDTASTEPVKVRLRAQTEEARVRGVFGAPTFFVGNAMFWGNDRLDDALGLAVATKKRTAP